MISIIAAALSAIALVVLVIAFLNFDILLDWFRGKTKLKQSDRDNIAFSLQERLSNGRYKTVQGIFNKRTNEVLDGQEIKSNDVESSLRQDHIEGDGLVIYE